MKLAVHGTAAQGACLWLDGALAEGRLLLVLPGWRWVDGRCAPSRSNAASKPPMCVRCWSWCRPNLAGAGPDAMTASFARAALHPATKACGWGPPVRGSPGTGKVA